MSYLHPREGLSRGWHMGCLHLGCLRHDGRCQGFHQGSIVPFRGTEGPTSFSQLTTCHGTCQISNCQRCTFPKCLIFHIHFGRDKDGLGNFSRTHILEAVFKKVAFETESSPRFYTQRPSGVQQKGWFLLLWTRIISYEPMTFRLTTNYHEHPWTTPNLFNDQDYNIIYVFPIFVNHMECMFRMWNFNSQLHSTCLSKWSYSSNRLRRFAKYRRPSRCRGWKIGRFKRIHMARWWITSYYSQFEFRLTVCYCHTVIQFYHNGTLPVSHNST